MIEKVISLSLMHYSKRRLIMFVVISLIKLKKVKMFQTDIEDSFPEDQKRDYSVATRSSPEKITLKLQKQQESFDNYAKYYYFLVQENSEVIERWIRKLKSNAQQNACLLKVFHKLLKGEVTTFTPFPDQTIKDLTRIIKGTIEQSKGNLSQDEKNFYKSILNVNKEIAHSIRAQWNILSDWTIQKLNYLDILSIFFSQGLFFIEKCKTRVMPISREIITSLFGFSKSQISKLLKIYKESHTFLRQIENRAIYQLVNIYNLIVLRNRMHFIVQNARRSTIDQTQYALYKPEYQRQHHQDTRLYNFCQIAFWSTQKKIKQLSYDRKFEIVQQLLKANSLKDVKDRFKALLHIKIIYNVSFESIFQIQNFYTQNQLKEIKKLLQSFQPSKTAELSIRFPYIFLKDDTFDTAFEKSGLSKKYDLKNFHRLLPSKMQAVFTLCRAAFQQTRQLSALLGNMLKCQQNHKRELITIKKFVISYENMKGLCKDTFQTQKQDLVCNLILITRQDRLLSWCIAREALKDQKYVKILKAMMKRMDFKPQSVVVLYQNQLGQLPQWRAFYRFYVYLLKSYDFRLYITNSPLYCQLAILFLSCVKMRIWKKQKSITRQNFYQIVEAETTIVWSLMRKKSFRDF